MDINVEFNKLDKLAKSKHELEVLKHSIEKEFKDNEILKKYINTIKKIDKVDKKLDEAKSYMYDMMQDIEDPILTGEYLQITLKKPYIRKQMNMTKFLEDYKSDSKMYKKYVEEKLVKGNVNLKFLYTKKIRKAR